MLASEGTGRLDGHQALLLADGVRMRSSGSSCDVIRIPDATATFTYSMDRPPAVYRLQTSGGIVVSGSERPLCKGDRVKFNSCSLTPEGTVVDEYSADYVSVQWDDLPSPATYNRRSLVRVEACTGLRDADAHGSALHGLP